jgi:hypothetical protein
MESYTLFGNSAATATAAPTQLVHTPRALSARIIAVEALYPETREAMWRLFCRYYTEVGREIFFSDLAQKSHVILIRERVDHEVKGFSTIQTYDAEVDGRRVAVLFSGDTIVDREYWGQTALQRAFLRFIIQYKLSHPLTPVYWFLISKGYKTYLLLSRNFPTYWPRHDRETPPWEQALIHKLAGEKFGDTYVPADGVLRFETCPCRLKQGVAPIDDQLRARYPEVRFFEQKNPGHSDGDELCCIGLINPTLWISYLAKLGWRKARKARKALRGAGGPR